MKLPQAYETEIYLDEDRDFVVIKQEDGGVNEVDMVLIAPHQLTALINELCRIRQELEQE